MRDHAWYLALIGQISLAELVDEPALPVKRAQEEVDGDQEIDCQQILGHKWREPYEQKSGEQKWITNAAVNPPDSKRE